MKRILFLLMLVTLVTVALNLSQVFAEESGDAGGNEKIYCEEDIPPPGTTQMEVATCWPISYAGATCSSWDVVDPLRGRDIPLSDDVKYNSLARRYGKESVCKFE